jgi:hypothetical protein
MNKEKNNRLTSKKSLATKDSPRSLDPAKKKNKVKTSVPNYQSDEDENESETIGNVHRNG